MNGSGNDASPAVGTNMSNFLGKTRKRQAMGYRPAPRLPAPFVMALASLAAACASPTSAMAQAMHGYMGSSLAGSEGLMAPGGAVLDRAAGGGSGQGVRDGATVVTPVQEVAWGEKALAEFLSGRSIDPDGSVALRVDRIGRGVAQVCDRPNLLYRFWVVKGDDLQAFSFPGGTVCLTSALVKLYESDDELAFALAHELSHIALRHHVAQLQIEEAVNTTQIDGKAFALLAAVKTRMSRDTEMEADRFGALYAMRAHYRYSASYESLERLERASSGAREDASHPLYASRIAALRKFKDELMRSLDAFDRGVAALENGDADDAIKYMTLFASQFPGSGAGLVNLGAAYLTRARQKSGTPEDLSEILPMLAEPDVILRGPFDIIDVQLAHDQFGRAARIDPEAPMAHAGLALCAQRLGNLDEARSQLAEARKLDPASPELALCAGNAEYLAKDYAKAIVYYEEALSRRSNWAPARKNLAMTYEKAGDAARAGIEWSILRADVRLGGLAQQRLKALNLAVDPQ